MTASQVDHYRTSQAPEIGEGDATTDVIDAQLGVYKADTARTLGGLIHQYLRYDVYCNFIKMRKTMSLELN